ncbi:CHAT domain-containing protein [Fusarium oxysporum]|nr:CHAT domain-containing protein [Fusarium oxysporum]
MNYQSSFESRMTPQSLVAPHMEPESSSMEQTFTNSQGRAVPSTAVAESSYTTQQSRLERVLQSYRDTNDPDLLEEIIQTARKVLEASTEDNAKLLHTLAWALYKRYKEVIDDYGDLEEAMKLERKAIEASPSGSMDRQRFSYWLALQLGDYFYHTRNLDDVDEAIGLIKSSLEKFPDESPTKAAHMANLGILLKEKYSVLRVNDDFESGCKSLETAIASSPEDQNTIATWLEKLADLYDAKHGNSGRLEDLETVCRLRRDSLSATADDRERDKLARRIQLARTLYELFEETRNLSELQESITLTRNTVAVTPEDDPEWLDRIRKLNVTIYILYHETGDSKDLEEAINVVKRYLEKASKDHPHWSEQLSNYANYLDSLHSRTGDLAHLEEAVEFGRMSLKDIPKNSPNLQIVLGNLSIVLSRRSMIRGSMVDLEESVSYARTALEVTPSDCPSRYIQLHNLGSMLLKRFSRNQENVRDLNQGIALLREALTSISSTNPEIESILSRLASALDTRHDKFGSSDDLEEGIEIARKAIASMGNPFVEGPTSISTLAALLKKRFRAGGSLEDIIEAIAISQKTLESMPEDSPFRTDLWTTLGDLFAAKFGTTWVTSDLEEAVRSYRCAVEHPTGNILRRIIAATSVMPLCLSLQDAYDIGRTAIDLVPGIATARSLETGDRQHLLSFARGLAASVTGAAIRLKKDPSEALAILEQGRGIMGSSLDDIRTDIKELQQSFPQLAERFMRLREELEPSTGSHFSDELEEDRGLRRRNAAENFDDLLDEIRKKPGFEDFLGPLTTDQILIERERITSMVFKDLDDGELIERAEGFDLGTPNTLEWLWNTITGRVLEALGFTETPPNQQEWPHVWWIPTGPLSRFPLHASGRHRERSGKAVMDRVISSYSPSLRALVHGRRQRVVTAGPAEALLIDAEHTGNHPHLPQARAEIKVVSKICESMAIRPVSVGQSKQDMLSCLRNCKIFHFAGHGYTNGDDPSKSHLCLSDTSDPLTVGDILKLNLHEASPFLSYLSACSTGRVQDDKFIDESIHLISAFQLAGFRHVIGTLWKVRDKHCVDVARVTYEAIREGGMTDDSVCRGLHKATRMLRDSWLEGFDKKRERLVQGDEKGTRDVIPCDDEEEIIVGLVPAYWVPYVHFGV